MCNKEGCISKSNNKKYGGFCYKHRREYLVDLERNVILNTDGKCLII